MAKASTDKPVSRKSRKAVDVDLPRGPGRPSGSINGPEQRVRLLDTALQLFARQGIVETPLAAIAREAGVTPAMLHYYFKSRDQLLDVLIEERIQPRREEIGKTFSADAGDPVTVITQLAERLMRTATEHPWFPSLWMREVFSDNGLLRQRIQQRYGTLHMQSAIDCITRWQREGRLNPDFEPSLLFITIFGLTILPLIATKAWQQDRLRRTLGPADIARHAVAILSHGVSPLP
ncbi:TetR/AcrR family transcriptional regulator [Dyella mobilis]|uniref:TetR/AcrR family transcriptional regulator n=1 Tax=Dyella mobilis TaxID=1849582 RepID=A0ABS2KBP7_9GAMM|nr:TetR/AcrR family transcriptional regulator [Dyella mobilis]MBM7128610.1 TetR/AcrR family transcriptional regulator [Dyella mobilis]GLQ99486.1 TetR family transcriptional regulator [Dyella mobilis]